LSSINDNIKRFTKGNSVPDGLADWYSKTGTEALNDAERRYLLAQGGTSDDYGTNDDLWNELLTNEGYTEGGLPFKKKAYWQAPVVFSLDDSGITPVFGEGSGTFTRATTATVIDHENVIREVLSGEVRFQGQRRVHNLFDDSEDVTTASWTETNVTTSGNVITTTSAFGRALQQVTVKANQSIVFSGKIRSISGNTNLAIYALNGGLNTFQSITISTSWQKFSFAVTPTAATATFEMMFQDRNSSNLAVYEVDELQIQNKTGASDPTVPDAYVSSGILSTPYHGVSVDGVKVFKSTNGNSVSSNIVTEAIGTPLTDSANWLVGFGTGDSFADGAAEWPVKVNETAPYGDNFTSVGRSGQDLTGLIGSNFATDIAATTGGFVILQGGVNDSTDQTAADMQAAVVVMEAEAIAQGKKFALINVSPFGNLGTWSSARQAVVESYNSLSAAWATANNIPYADIYDALGDAATPENLDAAYDSGDGNHPNEAGHQLIADTIIAAIKPYLDADAGVLPEKLPIGYFGEINSANNLIYSRDFTDAAWVKTNITAALDAVGVDGLPSGASSLTASAGNGTVFQTVTLTSAARTSSFYVRRKTGAGTIEYTDDGGTSYTDITLLINTSIYTRFDITTTQANPVVGFRITTSADAIDVDMCQVETLAFATSPIPTTTVATARALDTLSSPTTSIPVNDCVFSFDWTPTAAGQVLISLFSSGDAADELILFHNTTAFTFRKRVSSVNYDAQTNLTPVADTTYSIKCRYSSVDGVNIWLDGTKGGVSSTNTTNGVYSASIYIGDRYNLSIPQTGGIDNFTVYEGSYTDTEVVAL